MKSPRVGLRPVEESDLPFFFEHQQDSEASRMAVFTPRDRPAHDAHWQRILRDDTLFARTVLHDGRVAGNVVSWVAGGRRLVGYWIGREYWGRGLATAALQGLLDAVKERPLYAYVATTNVGSIRVLEKCGFRLVETRWDGGEVGEGIEERVMTLEE